MYYVGCPVHRVLRAESRPSPSQEEQEGEREVWAAALHRAGDLLQAGVPPGPRDTL